MKKQKRVRIDNKDLRKEQILLAATILAEKVGYQNITRNMIRDELKVSGALITHYFPLPELKKAIMKAALDKNIVSIIAQGIGAKDPIALKANTVVKKKAIEFLSNSIKI